MFIFDNNRKYIFENNSIHKVSDNTHVAKVNLHLFEVHKCNILENIPHKLVDTLVSW